MIEYLTNLDGIDPSQFNGFFVGWVRPLTIDQHFIILKNSDFLVLAYDKEKTKVVGFINAISDGIHFAFIPMLEVLPEYQHNGIGIELVRIMLELLKNFTCIDLTCDIEMQGFYEKFGMFKSNGMIMRKYLSGN